MSEQPAQPTVKLELPLDKLNVVMQALGQMPYAQAAPIIDSIQTQAQAQLQPAPAAEVAADEGEDA